MSAESIGALVGVLVYFGMKLVDHLLPPDTHFGFMDRLLHPNRKTKTEEVTDEE